MICNEYCHNMDSNKHLIKGKVSTNVHNVTQYQRWVFYYFIYVASAKS